MKEATEMAKEMTKEKIKEGKREYLFKTDIYVVLVKGFAHLNQNFCSLPRAKRSTFEVVSPPPSGGLQKFHVRNQTFDQHCIDLYCYDLPYTSRTAVLKTHGFMPIVLPVTHFSKRVHIDFIQFFR